MAEPGVGQLADVEDLIRAVEAKMRARAGKLAGACSGSINFDRDGKKLNIHITARYN